MGRSEARGLESSRPNRLGLIAKHPIYILEGPDGSGKTTLAKSIGGHYLHATYRFKGKMVPYHLALLKKAIELSQTDIVVIDRWRLSEVVYGTVFRGAVEQGDDATLELLLLAWKQNVTHVFCFPKNEQQYLDSFDKLKGEREEMYDNMVKPYRAYADVFHKFPFFMAKFRYDRFEHNVERYGIELRNWGRELNDNVPKNHPMFLALERRND